MTGPFWIVCQHTTEQYSSNRNQDQSSIKQLQFPRDALQMELGEKGAQWHSRGKAVGTRNRSNYCINYLISIHLQDPLTCTNHFKNEAKYSILTRLPWQEEKCGSRRMGKTRYAEIYMEIKAMKQFSIDIKEENLRKLLFFCHPLWSALIFFINVYFYVAACRCGWIDRIFPDIPEYKNPGWILSLLLPSSFTSEILQQCLERAHSASSATLLSCHFFLSLTLHSCHLRPLFPCPRSPPSSLSHSFSLILNSALVDRQRG